MDLNMWRLKHSTNGYTNVYSQYELEAHMGCGWVVDDPIARQVEERLPGLELDGYWPANAIATPDSPVGLMAAAVAKRIASARDSQNRYRAKMKEKRRLMNVDK
ncbi:MAG: hypothetical protein ACREUI_09970 [Burkholderiales bacterium]